MANETNSRENVGGAGLMDALMGGAMGEELPSAADGDDLLRLALSSTGIGPVDTPLDTPVDDSVFLEVDPLTVTGNHLSVVVIFRCFYPIQPHWLHQARRHQSLKLKMSQK